MKVEHKEECRTHSPDVILYGDASWGGGNKSVKYGWYDVLGRISRGGEVPIEALPQMLEVAIREGGLKVAPLAADDEGA